MKTTIRNTIILGTCKTFNIEHLPEFVLNELIGHLNMIYHIYRPGGTTHN